MADVTPQQSPAPDALAQYRSLLDQRIDGHSQLVPLDVLPALEREIEATLQPAHSREVSMAIAALGAWLKIPPKPLRTPSNSAKQWRRISLHADTRPTS